MQPHSLSPRLLICLGAVLFAFGLVGDGCLGIFFLTTSDLRWLALHVPLVLLWVLGLTVGTNFTASASGIARLVSASVVSPLLLGLCTFPGFGPVAYSLALVLTSWLHAHAAAGEAEALPAEQSLGTMARSLRTSRPLDTAIQPLVDVLHDVDTETRRTAITVLSRSGTPEAIGLLRQLLADPQLEIRSDASLALTRIEDELSRNLNAALEQWTAAPTDTQCMLNLVQQYCAYAESNLLDEVSERVYLEKARDLLEQVIDQGQRDAEQVLHLARLRQRLGEMTRALRDVAVAQQLAPEVPEASLLEMELAFHSRAWDKLMTLARKSRGGVALGDEEWQAALDWWATLPAGR